MTKRQRRGDRARALPRIRIACADSAKGSLSPRRCLRSEARNATTEVTYSPSTMSLLVLPADRGGVGRMISARPLDARSLVLTPGEAEGARIR
jgi:hypothetical protein